MTGVVGAGGLGPTVGELEVRERAVEARETAASDREELDRLRGETLRAREELARLRDEALLAQEKLARLRDEALLAREGAEQARRERDRLAEEVREVNTSLVASLVRANQLAEAAEAAHAEMAASEERFRSLVMTAASIVFQADAHGRVRVDAEAWESYTGHTPAVDVEAPGDAWLQAVHPDDRGATRAAWEVAVAGGTIFTHQHRLKRPSGSYGWVMARAVPIPTGGPVREWVGTMTDVTDQVRLEQTREHFIAMLAHDLRSPLNIVALATQLLEREGLTEPQGTMVGQINRGAQRMEVMIRDLLDFARGRLGGGIPIVRVPTDLRRCCADALDAAKLAHPHRPISLKAVGRLKGEWDPARLEQVFTNLLDNAVRHGTGPIRVALRAEGSAVVLAVHSEGPPIPEELLPEIFEPFHGRARVRGESLGLGLYIVSEIVRAHGGVIDVRSSAEEGTTFTARMPRTAPTGAKDDAPGRAVDPTSEPTRASDRRA